LHQKLPMTPHGMWIWEPHNVWKFFMNYGTCESLQVVFLGENTTHQIAGQGEVGIKLLDGKVRRIPNVLEGISILGWTHEEQHPLEHFIRPIEFLKIYETLKWSFSLELFCDYINYVV